MIDRRKSVKPVKRKRGCIVAIMIFATMVILVLCAFDARLKVKNYAVESPKITESIKLALVTDLHSCLYGDEQRELIKAIEDKNPDTVLLAGDIFDDWMPDDNTKTFIGGISGKYTTYYVSGNHEWWSGRMGEMFEYLNDNNVKSLRGECDVLNINGQSINICGIDDADAVRYGSTRKGVEEQLNSAFADAPNENFTVLLAHRPELIELYLKYDVDLILSGHAHGGQFRIPFFLNGLYAPNQGLFPEYAGGEYDFSGKRFIISRGLSRENQRIPRIFNRPELVFVTIK
ncbi:MAG: metallophosphoesterase [Clostridia bacterium]|nr:metallophosphoesterase [Clostridia bacterium]